MVFEAGLWWELGSGFLWQGGMSPVVFPHQAASSARAMLSGPPDKATVTRCVLDT